MGQLLGCFLGRQLMLGTGKILRKITLFSKTLTVDTFRVTDLKADHFVDNPIKALFESESSIVLEVL